jgi:hypothetical protein
MLRAPAVKREERFSEETANVRRIVLADKHSATR